MKNSILIVLLCLLTTLNVCPQNAAVVAENANLRGPPSEAGKVVETLGRGTSLEVIKKRGAWFLVQTSDFAGWLHGNTIRLIDGNAFQTDTETVPPTFPSDVPNKIYRRKRVATQRVGRVAASRDYIRGPRGGCNYINGSGGKTYVDQSLCN